MGESILYSWEDVDAPVLNASKGSMISLLRAVLVDGYGSKPGLGWTEVFTGTNKAVFQNEGTETLVQFDHNRLANKVYVRGFESMSDIDTGVLECPPLSVTDNYIWLKSAATYPANVVPWRILGDSKGIWIATAPVYADKGGYTTSVTGFWKMVYVGDYIPIDLTNIHHNFCFAISSSYAIASLDYWSVQNLANVMLRSYASRDVGNSPGATLIGLGSGTGYETTGLGVSIDMCSHTSELQFMSIPMIHTTNGILGRLPGLKNSFSKVNDTLSPDTIAHLDLEKPELLFDSGDYKEHFWRFGYSGSQCSYIVLTEGKGFRDGL